MVVRPAVERILRYGRLTGQVGLWRTLEPGLRSVYGGKAVPCVIAQIKLSEGPVGQAIA